MRFPGGLGAPCRKSLHVWRNHFRRRKGGKDPRRLRHQPAGEDTRLVTLELCPDHEAPAVVAQHHAGIYVEARWRQVDAELVAAGCAVARETAAEDAPEVRLE